MNLAQIKAAKDANRLDLQEFNHRKEYVEKMVNKEKRAKKLNESAYVTFEPFTPLPTHIDAKNEWEVKHPDNGNLIWNFGNNLVSSPNLYAQAAASSILKRCFEPPFFISTAAQDSFEDELQQILPRLLFPARKGSLEGSIS